MDLERLEAAVRNAIGRGSEAALEALQCREATTGELAFAAASLSERLEIVGPTAPDDPSQPWV